MGGGPDQEHMLIVLWEPEPKDVIANIKQRFPYIGIKYFQLKSTRSNVLPEGDAGVPKELWRSATIIVTLSQLPPTPEDCPNVKFIHLFSAGIDSWTHHPIWNDSNIPITTCSGIHGPPIAEWVLMTTLVASKHYNLTYEAQKQHKWGTQNKHLYEAEDWVGKRVGIAGYGSIGRQVARVFASLGCTILAYTATPRPTPASRADSGFIVSGTGDPDGSIPAAWYSGMSKAALHTFLAQDLDVLVLTLPLTPATTHLISTKELQILAQRRAFLINISRGGVVNQPALIEALNSDKLRGAALDVTDPEPLPKESSLWDAKGVIITPHVSALSVRYMERAYDVLVENLKRRERGERMVNIVDRKRGY